MANFSNAPLGNQWSSRMGECSGTNVTGEQWVLSILCMPCTMAHSKSLADGSNVVYNLLCWQPIAAYNSVRLDYGVDGVCGEDCAKVVFCPCCSTRQAYTEAAARGPISAAGAIAPGSTPSEWATGGSLFSCSATECCFAMCCPCVVAHRTRAAMQSNTDDWFDYCCVLPTAMYGAVRHRYNLQAECIDCPCMEDIAVGVFCFPCALARAHREAVAQKTRNAVQTVVGKVNDVKSKVTGKISKYTKI